MHFKEKKIKIIELEIRIIAKFKSFRFSSSWMPIYGSLWSSTRIRCKEQFYEMQERWCLEVHFQNQEWFIVFCLRHFNLLVRSLWFNKFRSMQRLSVLISSFVCSPRFSPLTQAPHHSPRYKTAERLDFVWHESSKDRWLRTCKSLLSIIGIYNLWDCWVIRPFFY